MEEQIKSAQRAGIPAVACPAVRIPRNPLLWPLGLVRLFAAIRQAKELLQEHRVDLALCMGSFACLPMGLAASKLGLPLFVHEGNARLGRANRFLSKRAHTLFLSFPLADGAKTRARQVLVGMPVRTQLRLAAEEPKDAETVGKLRQSLGLQPDLPVLLAFGGSQGAQAINELLLDTMGKLRQGDTKWQIIHLTGGTHSADYETIYKQSGVKCYVRRRDRHMHKLYRAADLVLCRAGASTIFELALFGKPALLIPYPGAVDKHQHANGQHVVDCGGGLLFDQTLIGPDLMLYHLRELMSKPEIYQSMGQKIGQLAKPQAAHQIVAAMAEAAGFELEPHEDPSIS